VSRRTLAALFSVLLAVPASAVSAASPLDGFLADVRRSELPNGVTLLVRSQPGSGVVAIDTWVKAGYFHEPDEVAGMAHLFEHMFFKGSEKFPGAESIAQELAILGGRSNAGTIYDSTNYYFVVPSEGFERAAEIMADAIAHPIFDPNELSKEAEVVVEESNRKLDNPPAVSLERMLATSFIEHRIRRWRIGSNEVLRSIRRDDLLRFFQTLYRPENLIVSVTGDLDPEEAERVVAATFGTIPTGQLDKRRGPGEPEQNGFRYGSSTADLAQAYTVLGWHTVGVGGKAEEALDLLATILGDGRASRLFRHAVGEGAAATADASHWQFEDVGVFNVQASYDPANRAEVDRRLLAEVERMRAHGPTSEELTRAVTVLRSRTLLGLESALGQSTSLAYAEANGGYRELGDRLARTAKVTADEVREAARRYLTVDRLTLYHYQPASSPALDRGAALAEVRTAVATAPPAEAAVAAAAAPRPLPAATADRGPVETMLSNGATVVVHERPGAPVVSVGLYLRGGRSAESSAEAGITTLAAASVRRGTSTRSGEAIDRAFEAIGTRLDSDVEADGFGLSVDVEASSLATAVELLADVALRPTFPEDGVAAERALQLARVRRSFDSSFVRPFDLVSSILYRSHPYGLPEAGTETSLAALGRDEVAAWWTRHLAAEDATLLVVGDVDAEAAKALVAKAFAELPKRGSTLPAVAAPAPLPARTELVEFRDRRQSAIVVSFPAVPATHGDAPALALLQSATSGLAGTFFAELRGRRSLAYAVFARPFFEREAGSFAAYLATEASKEPQALEALVAELRRLASDGLTEEDVARARSSLAGSTLIGLQTNGARLADYARNRLLGLPLDATTKRLEETNRATLADLQAVAKRYLTGDLYTTAILRGKS